MKQFFKFVFATVVGIFLTSVILLLALVAIVAAASSDKTVDVVPNSVLHIAIKYAVPERTANNPLANLSFLGIDGDKSVGLNDILANIKKAKTD